ncbi:unnamed protein product [Rangifer tarandus platyrhynchus]|uniref:Uncharacterized protein n=1 Tax=Rangifer tarandus platyrhynchus TaxID=3082113 RepID=A0AC59ZZD8_RANTA
MLLWKFTTDPLRQLQPQLQALVQNVTGTMSPNSTGALPAKWPEMAPLGTFTERQLGRSQSCAFADLITGPGTSFLALLQLRVKQLQLKL